MFNLIVTCVGSKKYKGPSIKNSIASLFQRGISDDVNELYKEWERKLLDQIASSSILLRAHELYQGSMWNASIEAFKEVNGQKKLWIISCGFGFISSEEKITGYNSTFKPWKRDSIFDKDYFHIMREKEVKKHWWNLLTDRGILETNNPKSIHELVNNAEANDIVLIAAGKDYYEAIFDDLSRIEISKKSPKLSLIGIKRENEEYYPEVTNGLHSYINSYSDGEELFTFLNKIFKNCNRTQIHLRAAQFIIRHYNKRAELHYRFP